jgi:uncharacterized protein
MTRTTQTLNRRCVIVFVRAPQMGTVKTRLEKVIDPYMVLEIYRCFAKDVIDTLKGSADAVRVCFCPSEQKASVVDWLGEALDYFPQIGKNLGERMGNAFMETFNRGFQQAVLVGADIPDLPGAVIRDAFSAIERGEAAIGPSRDGGYYLIGFGRNRFYPSIFNNIRWGANNVFKETLAAFQKLGVPLHIGSKWRDIDEYEDLLDFIDKCSPKSKAGIHTINCLKKFDLA